MRTDRRYVPGPGVVAVSIDGGGTAGVGALGGGGAVVGSCAVVGAGSVACADEAVSVDVVATDDGVEVL